METVAFCWVTAGNKFRPSCPGNGGCISFAPAFREEPTDKLPPLLGNPSESDELGALAPAVEERNDGILRPVC